MNRQSIIFIACLFIFLSGVPHFSCVAADYFMDIEFASSPNPVGSGARALGMGGAFIAVADDATAASWNPGGLIQLELPEISFVGDTFHRIEDNIFGTNPEASGEQTVSQLGMNYLSAAYPFELWKRNMAVSVSYQKRYDFARKWNFQILSEDKLTDFDYQREGNLSVLGFAYCIQVTPKFSFGLTLNIWDDKLTNNEWEEKVIQQGSGVDNGESFIFQAYNFDRYSFRGINANLGFLWNVTSRLTVGAVFKTPFEADLTHKHSFNASIRYPESPELGNDDLKPTIETDETIEMPMSYGIGVAYSFSREFTASLDIYRTEWGDFIRTDSEGRETSLITGQAVRDSDIDPTHQVRLGAEYVFITPKYIIPLCMGTFYDPAPAEGSPDDFFGFSIGSGIGLKGFHFDIAYQYRFGRDIGPSILKEWEFSQDVAEHTLYSSVVVHF
jgi:long-subunit fatty acid transport protein